MKKSTFTVYVYLESVSNCCLTPNEQFFFSYIIVRTSYIQWDDVHFVRRQNADSRWNRDKSIWCRENNQFICWPSYHMAVILLTGRVCIPTTWQSYFLQDGYVFLPHGSHTSYRMGMYSFHMAVILLTGWVCVPTTWQSYFLQDGYVFLPHGSHTSYRKVMYSFHMAVILLTGWVCIPSTWHPVFLQDESQSKTYFRWI
jgi:hypothetical protein